MDPECEIVVEGVAMDSDGDEGAIGFEDDGKEKSIGVRAAAVVEGNGGGAVVEKDSEGERKGRIKKGKKNKKKTYFSSSRKGIMCHGRCRKCQEWRRKKKIKKLHCLRLNYTI